MLIAEKKEKYTEKDYALLDEGAPFQLIDNDLIMSPAPTLLHQLILGEFYDVLKLFVKQHYPKALVVISPVDIYFDEGNVYQPDMVYLSEAKKQLISNGRIACSPDIVFEILSPSNAYYDLRKKKDVYEKYGVAEYIIVDPIDQKAELHSLENGMFVLKQKADVTGMIASVVLPGLVFDLSKIFV